MYQVYFGITHNPPSVSSFQKESIYFAEGLDYSTHYYWKIEARDTGGNTVSSPLWYFSTRRDPGIYPIGICELDASLSVFCDILVSHDYFYLVDDQRGLHIIDVSDPVRPSYAAIYEEEYITGAFIKDNIAYLTVYGSGLQIVDMADPYNPRELGRYDIPGSTSDIAIRDNYAYISGRDFYIFDVSNPDIPAIVGVCEDCGFFGSLEVAGNYVYGLHSGWETSYLDIVDISDASAPRLVGSCYAGGSAWSLSVYGDYVHMADWWFGSIRVFDISDPYNPTFTMSYGEDSMSGIYIHGNLAYCASSYHGLRIFDMSDELNPEPVAAFDTENSVVGVFFADGFIYLVENVPRLLILEYEP